MRSARTRTAALLVLLLAAACATPREEDARAPAPGETAPDLVLPLGTGGEFSLSGVTKERSVVVVFYRGKF